MSTVDTYVFLFLFAYLAQHASHPNSKPISFPSVFCGVVRRCPCSRHDTYSAFIRARAAQFTMTAAPQDADLGLNLVFESAPAPAPTAAKAPAKKRKNKYDRRREKGRLAKLAKEGEADKNSRDAAADKEKTAVSSNSAIIGSKSSSVAVVDINVADVSPKEFVNEQKQTNAPKVNDVFPSIKKNAIQQKSNITSATPSIAKDVGTPSEAVVNQTASSRRNRVSIRVNDDKMRQFVY